MLQLFDVQEELLIVRLVGLDHLGEAPVFSLQGRYLLCQMGHLWPLPYQLDIA